VMKVHRLFIDVRFQRVVVVWKVGDGEGLGQAPYAFSLS
jgi:hypothetical protein